MILSSGSVTVERKSAGRSTVALWKTYCWLRIVLPLPGTPMIRLIALRKRPPSRISSRRGLPLGRRSISAAASARRAGRDDGARPKQVAHCRHQLQRIQRLGQKGRSPGANRLVGLVDRGDSDDRGRRLGGELGAQAKAGAAGDQEVDQDQVGRPLVEDDLGLGRVHRDGDVVALGAQEILGEVRRVGVALGNQDQRASGRVGLGRADAAPARAARCCDRRRWASAALLPESIWDLMNLSCSISFRE